ncbi:MAG: transketolase [Oscillospiraceae bacterium]|nr:transketolase [Oscillospiraceae bacterium]
MEDTKDLKELRVFAEEIRVETLYELGMLGFGHIGGSMSIVETLAALYGREMKYDPKDPNWSERERLIVSKGHAGPALYATLSLKGFFPREMLSELNQGGGHLPSHCDRNKTPGVDMTTGSLGQGISTAIGVAMAQRMDGSDNYTYLILGDGECNEGQIWEGAMFAAHYKLDHLITFVDVNGQQLDGYTKDVMDMGDMGEKFAAFGWFVQDVNGHDLGEITAAIDAAKAQSGKPAAIILHTKKGNGCSFAEGIKDNHHMNFTPEQMKEAMTRAEAVLAAARAAL